MKTFFTTGCIGEPEFLVVTASSLKDAGRLCLRQSAGYADAAKRLCGCCQDAARSTPSAFTPS
jgi:hypothetical protein